MSARLIRDSAILLKTEGENVLPMSYPCPICKIELMNPKELQEHRMKKHRDVLTEIKF